MVKSPITGDRNVTLLRTIQSEQLICDWKKKLKIDITKELHANPEIFVYQCNQTKLIFFSPSNIAGSDKLYEQLEKFDWYYMPRKWEHDVAIQDLEGCNKVLEVGCGRGAFVERLCKEVQLDAQGIEINPSAFAYALSQGIPVSLLDLHELANEKAGYFDAVCTFQVLEHVPEPRKFLISLIKSIKPKGKLIISVPNSESFFKYCQNNLLDQPPHHMTQWCQETLNSLTSIFPIQAKRFRMEPLAEYHIGDYISIQVSRLPKIWRLQGLAHRAANLVLKPILKYSPSIRTLISGHTLYVCFEKIG